MSINKTQILDLDLNLRLALIWHLKVDVGKVVFENILIQHIHSFSISQYM